MEIKITAIDTIENKYMDLDYRNVIKYYFDNDFLIMEFETNNILMLNKNNIIQILIK